MNPNRMFLPLAAMILVASGCSRPATSNEDNASAPPPPKSTVASSASPAPSQQPAPSPARPPSIDAINDTAITARTKAGILADPGMAGADVSVNTDRGVVSLTGIVKSQEQAAIASAYAQRQDGVMRVDNELAVNLQ